MLEIAAPSLRERTTLRLGGKAIAEIRPQNFSDLEKLPEAASRLGGKIFFLGRGSNILAMDGDLDVLLLRPEFGKAPALAGRDEQGNWLVRVSADAPMPALMRFCLENELSGLEGLVGIPGSVGGAVAMNAGSFGSQTADCLLDVLVYAENDIKSIKIADMRPGYRKMDFPSLAEEPLILEATFALTKGLKSDIFRAMNHNFFYKKSRQPLRAWSAGSAFKNPGGGRYAARLLEDAGFRGKKLGGMAFSAKHANFLVNEGKGESAAALDLLEEAREAVKKLSGIELEREIRIINWL